MGLPAGRRITGTPIWRRQPPNKSLSHQSSGVLQRPGLDFIPEVVENTPQTPTSRQEGRPMFTAILGFFKGNKLLIGIIGGAMYTAIIAGVALKAGIAWERSDQQTAKLELITKLAGTKAEHAKEIASLQNSLKQARFKYYDAKRKLRNDPKVANWLATPVPISIVRLIWVRKGTDRDKRLHRRRISDRGSANYGRAERSLKRSLVRFNYGSQWGYQARQNQKGKTQSPTGTL